MLVPSFTFAASVNAILYEGATPVFVDIEPDTFNIDPSEIEARRTDATRAVMVVDVFLDDQVARDPAALVKIARTST